VDCQSAEADVDSLHESISDTKIWLHWIGDCNNGDDSDDSWGADIGSDIDLENAVPNLECQVQQDQTVAPNVSGFMRPTTRLNKKAEKWLITLNAMDMMRNKWNKALEDRMRQFVSAGSYVA
jgi:hypothetical protein